MHIQQLYVLSLHILSTVFITKSFKVCRYICQSINVPCHNVVKKSPFPLMTQILKEDREKDGRKVEELQIQRRLKKQSTNLTRPLQLPLAKIRPIKH